MYHATKGVGPGDNVVMLSEIIVLVAIAKDLPISLARSSLDYGCCYIGQAYRVYAVAHNSSNVAQ